MKKIEGIEILKREPDFSGIKWVAKARDKECRAKTFNNLFFEDGFWVATNGHRLHIYDTDIAYENGLYDILVNNISQLILKKNDSNVKFPRWQNIVTKKTYPAGLELNFLMPIAYTQIVRELPINLTIDFIYLQDLLKNTDVLWTAQIDQPGDGVIFVSNNKIGIIMPMNM